MHAFAIAVLILMAICTLTTTVEIGRTDLNTTNAVTWLVHAAFLVWSIKVVTGS